MLYLISSHGETIPQTLPKLRDNIPFPFKVQCKAAINDSIKPGTVVCIVGFKLGKYLTSDGLQVTGDEQAWCLYG